MLPARWGGEARGWAEQLFTSPSVCIGLHRGCLCAFIAALLTLLPAELLPGLERPEELGHLEAEEQAVTELVVRAREVLRTGPEPPSPETGVKPRPGAHSGAGGGLCLLRCQCLQPTEREGLHCCGLPWHSGLPHHPL